MVEVGARRVINKASHQQLVSRSGDEIKTVHTMGDDQHGRVLFRPQRQKAS